MVSEYLNWRMRRRSRKDEHRAVMQGGIGSFGCSLAMQWNVHSRTGDYTNDGPKSAYKTIRHAMHAVKSGDTVFIAPGAYDPNLPKQISALRAANVVGTV